MQPTRTSSRRRKLSERSRAEPAPARGRHATHSALLFAVPTIANGKVSVGTRGNNTGGRFGSIRVSVEPDAQGLKTP